MHVGIILSSLYDAGVHKPQRDVDVGLRGVPAALPLPGRLGAVPRPAVPPRADRVLRNMPRDAGQYIFATLQLLIIIYFYK